MKNLLFLLLVIISPLCKSQSNGQLSSDLKIKSVVVLDTTKYLMEQNKIITNALNNYREQTIVGRNQLLIGTFISTIGYIIYNQNDVPAYYFIVGGSVFQIIGAINIYKSVNYLKF
jgi:hypothetical protein